MLRVYASQTLRRGQKWNGRGDVSGANYEVDMMHTMRSSTLQACTFTIKNGHGFIKHADQLLNGHIILYFCIIIIQILQSPTKSINRHV